AFSVTPGINEVACEPLISAALFGQRQSVGACIAGTPPAAADQATSAGAQSPLIEFASREPLLFRLVIGFQRTSSFRVTHELPRARRTAAADTRQSWSAIEGNRKRFSAIRFCVGGCR